MACGNRYFRRDAGFRNENDLRFPRAVAIAAAIREFTLKHTDREDIFGLDIRRSLYQ